MSVRTERDLLSGLGRQEKREQQQHGDERARDEEVERVVECTPAHVHRVRYVDVRLLAALIRVHVSLHRRRYSTHTHTDRTLTSY